MEGTADLALTTRGANTGNWRSVDTAIRDTPDETIVGELTGLAVGDHSDISTVGAGGPGGPAMVSFRRLPRQPLERPGTAGRVAIVPVY